MHVYLKRVLRNVLGEGRLYREVHARRWARRLRRGGHHELNPIIARHVRAGDVCIDIGAHGGSATAPLSRAVGNRGHVYAIEARKDYASTLERTLALLRLRNVTIVPFAVGNKNEEASFVVEAHGEDITGRSHLASNGEAKGSMKVPMRTLDGLVEEIPGMAEASFVKIDVEGAELFVLHGGLNFLKRNRPVVYCEVQDEHCQRYGHDAATVIEVFAELGYVSQKITHADVLFVHSKGRAS